MAKKLIINPVTSKLQIIDTSIEGLGAFLEGLGMVRSDWDLTTNANLTVQLSAGNLIKYNPVTGKVEECPISAENPVVFDILGADGSVVAASVSDVDFTKLDDGLGGISTLPQANDATFVEFFINELGDVRMLYGQILYSTVNVGRQSYFRERKVLPAALDGFVRMGGFIGRRDTSSLQAGNVYQVYASKLGEVNGF